MSKRCKLQKEYYKEFGNYKGDGKYTDHYVNWLESKVLALTIPVVSNHVVCDDWIHQERIKNNDDNYCPICGEQLQSK